MLGIMKGNSLYYYFSAICLGKVFSLEQDGFSLVQGCGIGTDISKVQSSRMPPFSELRPCQYGPSSLCDIERMYFNMKIRNQGFQLSNRLKAPSGFDHHAQFQVGNSRHLSDGIAGKCLFYAISFFSPKQDGNHC
jgi:hypothetical protein